MKAINLTMGNANYDLNDNKELLKLVIELTDGIWNEGDSKTFDADELRALKEVREYYKIIK